MKRLVEIDLRGAEIEDADLRESWLRRPDLENAHVRAADLTNAEIDGEIGGLVINGVEVSDLIEAELDRRHPERAVLHADTPDELRTGWSGLESMWQATLERVAMMPADTPELSVHGEWSLSQTLRHLVFATDVWLNDAVLRRAHPYHPLGEPFSGWRDRASAAGIELDPQVAFLDVLEMRSQRQAQVRKYLASVTDNDLAATAAEPFFTANAFDVRQCLWIITNEEWQHHRYVTRDLNVLAGEDPGAPG